MSKFFYITKPEELGVSKNNQKNCPEKQKLQDLNDQKILRKHS